MLKKKSMILGSAIMCLLISGSAFASSATGGKGNYSASLSRSGGYTYISSYVQNDPSARQTIGLKWDGGSKSKARTGNGNVDLNCPSKNSYGSYNTTGHYGTFRGILK
ncbi:hypothetical protein [Clostridium sp. L74]|uniref:hypothetical protein n=1 Tax=Clostridium sp. L74 TaxID=1560217 RepID=UPI0006AB85E9|nr:hypothetical protein [Clostridium sp. L74]KOR25404.1 hypothetical protein ND00_17100 [Clostridium sp. L74]